MPLSLVLESFFACAQLLGWLRASLPPAMPWNKSVVCCPPAADPSGYGRKGGRASGSGGAEGEEEEEKAAPATAWQQQCLCTPNQWFVS